MICSSCVYAQQTMYTKCTQWQSSVHIVSQLPVTDHFTRLGTLGKVGTSTKSKGRPIKLLNFQFWYKALVLMTMSFETRTKNEHPHAQVTRQLKIETGVVTAPIFHKSGHQQTCRLSTTEIWICCLSSADVGQHARESVLQQIVATTMKAQISNGQSSAAYTANENHYCFLCYIYYVI